MSQRPCYSRLQSTRQHTPPIYLSAPTPIYIYSPIYSSAHLPSLLNHLRHAPLNLAAFHNMLVINLLVNASLATAASPTLDPLHTPVKKLRRFSQFRSPPLLLTNHYNIPTIHQLLLRNTQKPLQYCHNTQHIYIHLKHYSHNNTKLNQFVLQIFLPF